MAITTNVVNANGTTPLPVGQGGTSTTSVTTFALLKGDAAGHVSSLPAGTDGQLPIGSTASDPVMATLTQGSGITITNGPGSITIAATGGGGGITTLDGNAGSATGGTVTMDASTSSGASVVFTGSGSTMALEIGDTGTGNCFVGNGSGNGAASGDTNTCLGMNIMSALTTGNFNTSIGQQSLQSLTTGSDNVAVGRDAMEESIGASNNVALGSVALGNLATGTTNIAVGYFAGSNYTTTEDSNILIGNAGVVAESNVIRIGTTGTGTGLQNTCFLAGTYGVTPGGMGIQNVVIDSNGQLGSSSGGGGGISTLDGDSGSATGSTVTIAAGGNCGGSVSFSAASATVSLIVTDSSNNTFIGKQSGNNTLSGSANVGLGLQSLLSVTTGSSNVAVGVGTMVSLDAGANNNAFGNSSQQSVTSGQLNTSIGDSSLGSLQTGNQNIAVGYQAGINYSTESSNICIGNNGTPADANVTRIGTEGAGLGQQNTCFIAGIANATVVGSAVLVNTSTGQLGVAVSSEKFKHNIKDMGDKSDALMKLRPVTYSYKSDPANSMQYGLIAEEVAEVMPHIVTYDAYGHPYTVRFHEIPVILLNEVQKLAKRVEQLEAKLAAKE